MSISSVSNKPVYQPSVAQTSRRELEARQTPPVIPSLEKQNARLSRGGQQSRDCFGGGQAQGAQWQQFASGVKELMHSIQELQHTLSDLSHGMQGAQAQSSSSMPQGSAASQGMGGSGSDMNAYGQAQEQVPDLGDDSGSQSTTPSTQAASSSSTQPQPIQAQSNPAQGSSTSSSSDQAGDTGAVQSKPSSTQSSSTQPASTQSSSTQSSSTQSGSPVKSLLAPDQATADAEIKRQYDDWKGKYVTDQGTGGAGQLRVVRPEDGRDTVSEGIGYGMMLAAQNGDQKTFDGLWKYAQGHLNQNGVMDWKIDANNKVIGANGATDADEDMAMALVVADKKFGGYKEDATKLINNIKEHEVEPGTNVLKPGDAWGGSDKTNPSYFAPAYYKAFGEFTGDKSWDKVADKSYDILDKIAQQPGYKDTGLVPDWCSAEGVPSPDGGKYSYDASRTPWRIGTDAAWYGDKRATAFLDKLNGFWGKQGLGNISDGYDASGNATSGNHNATFTATAAAGAITSSDANFRSQAWKEALAAPGGNYFNDSLRALSVLQIGGRMEKP